MLDSVIIRLLVPWWVLLIKYWVIYKSWENFFLALNSHTVSADRWEDDRNANDATNTRVMLQCWVTLCHKWVIWWCLPDDLASFGFGYFTWCQEKIYFHTHTVPSIGHIIQLISVTQTFIFPLSCSSFLSVEQNLRLLEFITLLQVPFLKYIHSKCLLVPDTLDSLLWGSQTR